MDEDKAPSVLTRVPIERPDYVSCNSFTSPIECYGTYACIERVLGGWPSQRMRGNAGGSMLSRSGRGGRLYIGLGSSHEIQLHIELLFDRGLKVLKGGPRLLTILVRALDHYLDQLI